MANNVKPIPEGYEHVTPYLIIRGASKAIDFYKKVLGAVEAARYENNGKIGHAEIRIGRSLIMLADEYPEMNIKSPDSLGGSPVMIHLYVENVDAVFNHALAEGSRILQPLQDKFYGDRAGTLIDPFGHTWSLATHIEDVSPEEMKRRMETASKPQ
ncbi:MAG TPA: VOC family protein [Acidobacteriota bacterium]|nr:VOC family protein [Acidobacteriota bacterium]